MSVLRKTLSHGETCFGLAFVRSLGLQPLAKTYGKDELCCVAGILFEITVVTIVYINTLWI